MFLINNERCSARNERNETDRCKEGFVITASCFSNSCRALPAAYSLSVNLSEIYTCQLGKERLRDSIHSLMPASPVLISCPPPTKQITTAQSGCLSKQEIKNSGSE